MVEVGFIIFLFYSNLLMGEFTQTSGQGKSMAFAIRDIFTVTNFGIAIFSGLIGYVVFEFLRKRLDLVPAIGPCWVTAKYEVFRNSTRKTRGDGGSEAPATTDFPG